MGAIARRGPASLAVAAVGRLDMDRAVAALLHGIFDNFVSKVVAIFFLYNWHAGHKIDFQVLPVITFFVIRIVTIAAVSVKLDGPQNVFQCLHGYGQEFSFGHP